MESELPDLPGLGQEKKPVRRKQIPVKVEIANTGVSAEHKKEVASKTGAPPMQLDPVKAEEFARKGLKPAAIARLLGCDPRTLKARMEDTQALRDAVETGWAHKQEELLDSLKSHEAKSFIPIMFSLKQSHLGGWADTPPAAATGQLEIVVSHRVLSLEEQLNPPIEINPDRDKLAAPKDGPIIRLGKS